MRCGVELPRRCVPELQNFRWAFGRTPLQILRHWQKLKRRLQKFFSLLLNRVTCCRSRETSIRQRWSGQFIWDNGDQRSCGSAGRDSSESGGLKFPVRFLGFHAKAIDEREIFFNCRIFGGEELVPVENRVGSGKEAKSLCFFR